MKLNKNLFSGLLVASITSAIFLMPNQAILGASAELPEDFVQNEAIQSRLGINQIVKSYSSYQGSSVYNTYTERKNGDTYYYEGYLEYTGKNGKYYQYLGNKNDFKLYKILTSGGQTITPNALN